jgi:phosphate transport system substrate-binding protein
VRFLKDQVKDSLSKNSFAVKNNPSLIEYVAKNKNAIGVIGVNWISDRDDSVTNKFLGKIKVVGLATDSAAAAGSAEYFQPYQGYIAKKLYPLSREVYIISSEARAGLGSGLTAFISSDKGQRIILKAGLVPATAPIRLVELKEDNTQYNK